MSPTLSIVIKPPSLSPWNNPPALLVTVPVAKSTAPQFTPASVPEVVSVPSVVLPPISSPLIPPWIRPALVIVPNEPVASFTMPVL